MIKDLAFTIAFLMVAAFVFVVFIIVLIFPVSGHATVVWDFNATSCTLSYGTNGCSPTQQYPALLATLTLPGPDSSGSAVWTGGLDSQVFPPVYTGDAFTLDWNGNGRYPQISSNFPQNVRGGGGPLHTCSSGDDICDFNVSWTEIAGQLTAIYITIDGFNDALDVVYDTATIASNDTYSALGFSGCSQSNCTIIGFWVDSPATVPEPGTLALLTGALAAFLWKRGSMVAALVVGMAALLWASSARSAEYVLQSDGGPAPGWIPLRMGEVGQILKGVGADGLPHWECPDGAPLGDLTYRSSLDGTLRTIKACAGTEIHHGGSDAHR